MSFREKSAWITLIAILLVIALYAFHVPQIVERNPGGWMLHALEASVAAFIVIELVAHVVLYLRNPKDARTPKDERERLIDLKARRIASWVYVVGSFLGVATIHHGANGIAVAYFVLFAFVIAEIVNHGARIVFYRRGF